MVRRDFGNVMKEFFRRSNIWLLELVVNIVPTTNDYYLQTGQNANVIRLMSLTRPSFPPDTPPVYIPPVNGDPPQYLLLSPTGPGNNAQSQYARVPRDGGLLSAGCKTPILRIHWNPGSNDWWIATVSLNISEDTDDNGFPILYPNWILEKYFEYFQDGILAKLMLQANKPYSNEKGAMYHYRKFHEGIGLARTEVRNYFTYSGQAWLYPQTFAARHPRVQ